MTRRAMRRDNNHPPTERPAQTAPQIVRAVDPSNQRTRKGRWLGFTQSGWRPQR